MELAEAIKSINQGLISLYGIDTISGEPIWRVVWSEDQIEKRRMNVTDSGIALLVPEVREVPKYRQWIKEKYVLERLTIVPEINADELPVSRLSYEPLWVFEDKNGNYLPPKLLVCKFVIDGVYAALGKSSMAKYVDPDNNSEAAKLNREQRLFDLEREIFGNETSTTDALHQRRGVVVPSNIITTKES